MSIATTNKTDRIRYLNDLARRQPHQVNAQCFFTPGILALLQADAPLEAENTGLDLVKHVALSREIATYDKFNPDNDPHGEHDFGSFVFDGEKVFWKIDYYHPDRDRHAPDPSSVEQCRRIITVMLASEY
jgi:hypothetical protein